MEESDLKGFPCEKKGSLRWYHKPWAIAAAILCFGPIALPLVWGRPGTSLAVKASVTIAVVILTVWMLIGAAKSVEIILLHYRDLAEAMR